MGWIMRFGELRSTSFEHVRNAGVITSPNCTITSTPCPGGAQWRFTPNAGRTTYEDDGEKPVCQANKVWRKVLS